VLDGGGGYKQYSGASTEVIFTFHKKRNKKYAMWIQMICLLYLDNRNILPSHKI
jgi:hypothetical protein